MSDVNLFPTINETHKINPSLSVYTLRKWVKEEKVPYIKCGNRVRINYKKLMEILDDLSVNDKCR